MKGLLFQYAFVAYVALLSAGCLLEADRSCGSNQELTEVNVCICSANAVVSETAPGACVLCGANQVVLGGKCTCTEGFIAGPGDVCQPKPSGLGDACDPAVPVCTNPLFPSCQAGSSGGGYCTKAGCAAAGDCPSGYGCDTNVAGGVCKRAPTGQGKACASDAECAGTEAIVCGAPLLNSCLVQGCSTTTVGSCFPGYLCCDLTALGVAKNLCLPLAKCP